MVSVMPGKATSGEERTDSSKGKVGAFFSESTSRCDWEKEEEHKNCFLFSSLILPLPGVSCA